MPCQIEKKDGFFEVCVSGETSKSEVLRVVQELHRLDSGKKFPDLWVIARESEVPFVHFAEIAESIRKLLPRGAVGNRTAIVAADVFHEAQLDMYRAEASILPFPVRVFLCRDEAVKWLKDSGAPSAPHTVPGSTPRCADSAR